MKKSCVLVLRNPPDFGNLPIIFRFFKTFKLLSKNMNHIEPFRFFIIYPLNLEDLGLMELSHKFDKHFIGESFILINKISGGIEIECSLLAGLNLNHILRSPTRILLRIGEFKCRDAPKLYQKISKFNWSPWLIGQTPEVEIATNNSRLFDSRKIEKAIQDGVQQYYRHRPVKKKYLDHLSAITDLNKLPKIFFRSVDDICTISLDTTSERLHLRGEKILTGLAPIRESLAALLLLELKLHLKNKTYTLIDPMCGSGTFLLEADSINSITVKRNFSYLHIPLYLDQTKNESKMEVIEDQIFSSFLGFEVNPEVVKLSQQNCLNTKIIIKQADLFKSDFGLTIQKPSVAIINPPYGIRVGERGDAQNEINLQFYINIIENVSMKIQAEYLGIIIPYEYLLKPQKNFSILSTRSFKNGGIEVVFYVLEFK